MNKINIKKIILSNIFIAFISIIFSVLVILFVNINQSKKKYTYEHILVTKINISKFSQRDIIYNKYFNEYFNSKELNDTLDQYSLFHSELFFFIHQHPENQYNLETQGSEYPKLFSLNKEMLHSSNYKGFVNNLPEKTSYFLDNEFQLNLKFFYDEKIIKNFLKLENLNSGDQKKFHELIKKVKFVDYDDFPHAYYFTFAINENYKDFDRSIDIQYLLRAYLNYFFDIKFLEFLSPYFISKFKDDLNQIKNSILLHRKNVLKYRELDFKHFSQCINEQLQIAKDSDIAFTVIHPNDLIQRMDRQKFRCNETFYLYGYRTLSKIKKRNKVWDHLSYLDNYLTTIDNLEKAINNFENLILTYPFIGQKINKKPILFNIQLFNSYTKDSKINITLSILFVILNSFLIFFVIFIFKKKFFNQRI